MALVFGILLAVVSVPMLADDIHFPDPKLEAAVRAAIGVPTRDIQAADLSELTFLDARFLGITTLEGIQHCTNLTELRLFGNEITDISPLSGLVKLTILHLDSNLISDIDALSNLTNLTMLMMNNNQIADITALSGLNNLETLLSLSGNEITDIAALSNLTHLMRLDLADNKIIDISVLSNLGNLTGLGLANNKIVDISVLSGLTRLAKIWLTNNQISDAGALVDNAGFGTGDSVDLRLNCLALMPGAHDMLDIDTLRSRGVIVEADPQNPCDTVKPEIDSSATSGNWWLLLGVSGALAAILAALLLF